MLSRKVMNLSLTGIDAIVEQAILLEKQGRKLIHLEFGRPDFTSPQIAIDEVKKALDEGKVHYTNERGIGALRQAISDKEKRRHNLSYDPKTEIVVTAGACEALTAAFLSLLNPGDEMIAIGPCFFAYPEQAMMGEFRLVEMELSMENDWAIDMEQLESLRSEKTRAILINSPNNPAGYILSHKDLEQISHFAQKYNLMVVSDECYDEFSYDEKTESIANYPNMRERTIVVKSASKSYAMTGWRIGYLLGPQKYLDYMHKLHQNFSTCATSFAQYGAVPAFEKADDFIDNMVSTFKQRRDYFYEELSKIQRLKIKKPDGAFYMFPDVSAYGKSEVDISEILLHQANVVTIPGIYFGKSGKGHIRMAYCRSMEELEIAARNIKAVLESLS